MKASKFTKESIDAEMRYFNSYTLKDTSLTPKQKKKVKGKIYSTLENIF